MGLKWMSIFCPQAQHVLKTDDDIYVNVQLLHRSLFFEAQTLSQNIHGCVKNSPLNSPLPIPKEGQQVPHATLMKPALPQFTAGAGYLIPGSFVPELYTGVQFKLKNRSIGLYIQFRKMNMDHLLNKPYVNEVTLRWQTLP